MLVPSGHWESGDPPLCASAELGVSLGSSLVFWSLLSFRKLSFRPSRTYLQEPARCRSGGIQTCPTSTRVSSPRPLSSPPLFSFRHWASWRNPPPPRQAPPNQLHPYHRIAGCTSALSVPTPRVKAFESLAPTNRPKKSSPPSTRNAFMPAR